MPEKKNPHLQAKKIHLIIYKQLAEEAQTPVSANSMKPGFWLQQLCDTASKFNQFLVQESTPVASETR